MASPRSVLRIAINIALDGALAALAVPAARWLAAPGTEWLRPLWTLPAGTLCLLIAGIPFRLSLQYWRFAGLGELIAVAASSLIAAGLFGIALHLGGQHLPSLTFPLVHALTLLTLLGAPRVGYRFGQGFRQTRAGEDEDVLPSAVLIGGAEAADLFLRALEQERRPLFRVQGLIALSARQSGRRIHNHPILGSLDELGAVLDRLRAETRLPSILVVTDPDLAGPALAGLLDEADRHGLQVRRAPRPTALGPAGRGGAERPAIALQPVAIEDLLNRPQVPLDREGMARLVQQRRVLVTGAGGTIGSELARQVAALGPEELVLLDNGEFALWQIDLELAENHPLVPRRTIIADIRDAVRLRT
ncbi:MAG: polysaccharide biosynthesis protein, partial [Alphaproteobacteria bacterium]|nr:polysaccharide biosynthesis protein [Alphaproteobacteria bacterium]